MKKSRLIICIIVLLSVIGIAGFFIYDPEERELQDQEGSVIVCKSSKDFVHVSTDNREEYFSKSHIRMVYLRRSSEPYVVSIVYTTGSSRHYRFKTQEDASEFARRLTRAASE